MGRTWIFFAVAFISCVTQLYLFVLFQLAESDMREHRRNLPVLPETDHLQPHERLIKTFLHTTDRYVWLSKLYQKAELSRTYEEYGLWLNVLISLAVCSYGLWDSRKMCTMLNQSSDKNRRLLEINSKLSHKNYELRKELRVLGVAPGEVKLMSM